MPSPDPVSARQVFSSPVLLLAFGFGTGLSPRAPGTVGTAAAIPLFLIIEPLSPIVYWVVTGTLLLVGFWICGASNRVLPDRDHAGIVWDEMTGFLIAMGFTRAEWIWIGLGFLLFRFFDIIKLWPASLIDRRFHGGFGIMLDDAVAGLYTMLVLNAVTMWVEG